MAIGKQTLLDQITVTENGIILYREATRIIEDGTLLTQTYHRSSLTPGSGLTGKPAQVVAIATVVWTPEVIAAYEAQVAAQQPIAPVTEEEVVEEEADDDSA